jgi:hypothetical protein
VHYVAIKGEQSLHETWQHIPWFYKLLDPKWKGKLHVIQSCTLFPKQSSPQVSWQQYPDFPKW